MSRLDYCRFLPLPAATAARRQSGRSSGGDKYAGWWAGASEASPTSTVLAPALNSVKMIRRMVDEGDLDGLDYYHKDQAEYLRWWVRRVLSVDAGVPVVFESDGGAARSAAERILANARSADEGELVVVSLFEVEPISSSFDVADSGPGVLPRFFSEPGVSFPLAAGRSVAEIPFDAEHLSDEVLLEKLEELLRSYSNQAICLAAPTVAETGRIFPVRGIAAVIEKLRGQGLNISYLVDDRQGFSRMPFDLVADPLVGLGCDAYLFSSGRALGSITDLAALVVREDVLLANCRVLDDRKVVSRFQLEPRFEELLPDSAFRDSAVPVSEVVAMHVALMDLFHRGDGKEFEARRQTQLSRIAKTRRRLLDAVSTLDGITVVGIEDENAHVPSILCIRSTGSRASASDLTRFLQQSEASINLSAPVGDCLRIELPEYREVPSLDRLISTLRSALSRFAA